MPIVELVELDKRTLIHNNLDEIAMKKKIYHKKMMKLKRIDNVSESIIIASGAIAVSNLFVTLAVINPITLTIGATFSSISTVGGAVKRVFDVRAKYESIRTTYHQLNDLERTTRAILAKNHMTEEQYLNLLDDMNNQMSLIEDTAIPITIVSKSKK